MGADGTLFVADSGNHRIRVVSQQGEVRTLAGSGVAGHKDGSGATSQFFYPVGIAIDADGTLFVTDRANHRVRKVTSKGTVSTLAGSGRNAVEDGKGQAASFSFPNAIATVRRLRRSPHAAGGIPAMPLATHTRPKHTRSSPPGHRRAAALRAVCAASHGRAPAVFAAHSCARCHAAPKPSVRGACPPWSSMRRILPAVGQSTFRTRSRSASAASSAMGRRELWPLESRRQPQSLRRRPSPRSRQPRCWSRNRKRRRRQRTR